jgi:hypothetical protein
MKINSILTCIVSDLKGWLDERGIPVPQPTTRDKLIASVRRNARIASLKAAAAQASASKSAADAAQTLSDKLLESWSDSRTLFVYPISIENTLMHEKKSSSGPMRTGSRSHKVAREMS